MDLADHFRVIAANWWRILLVTVLVGAGVFTFSSRQEKVYEAKVLLNLAVRQTIQFENVSESQLAFRAGIFAQTLETEGNAQRAVKVELPISPLRDRSYTLADEYGLDADAALDKVGTATNDLNGLLLVTGHGNSTIQAKDVTEAFAIALIETNREQQQQLIDAEQERLEGVIADFDAQITSERAKPDGERNDQIISIAETQKAINQAALIAVNSGSPIDIQPIGSNAAAVNQDPIAPHPTLYAIFAGLFALFFTAELFVVRRALSDRLGRTNDIEQITAFTGLPVLAMIPRGRGPEIVEAFRTLRTNLMFLEGSGRPRTIALVSPNPGAGKSFAAMHLAESAVAVDASVVLVDADLRRPVLHTRLRVPREPGLSDALRGRSLADTLHRPEGSPNLLVMPSGSPVNDTVGVLGGRAFRQILDSLDSAELIVVDTPPGAVYADALAVAAQCDAALLVLDSRTTRRRAARQLIESLERTGASLIGVVVNSAQLSRRDTYERA